MTDTNNTDGAALLPVTPDIDEAKVGRRMLVMVPRPITLVITDDDKQAACDLIGNDSYGKPVWTVDTISPENRVVQAFARHRIATQEDAERSGAGSVERAAMTDDPDWICAGIPDEAIEAGMEVFRQVDTDNENYVAGETTDWDEGMVVGAIFKAVARSIIASTPQRQEYDGEAGAIETTGCNYCGAQVALMGADYLERIAEALDAAGAPRKSTDGLVHFGLIDRIAALAHPAQARDEMRENGRG